MSILLTTICLIAATSMTHGCVRTGTSCICTLTSAVTTRERPMPRIIDDGLTGTTQLRCRRGCFLLTAL
ncbi:unnamed protein product [Dicrocoelium dendriticum]|nr:unnamed protein product [Dicrocoelium dendriticum]